MTAVTHDLTSDPGARVAGRTLAVIASVCGVAPEAMRPDYKLPASHFVRMRIAATLRERLSVPPIKVADWLRWTDALDVAEYVAARVNGGGR